MGKFIFVDIINLSFQLIGLDGAAGSLTESGKMAVENIEGMPASLEMVAATEKLDEALRAFQDLVKRDGKQLQQIATDLVNADKASAGK